MNWKIISCILFLGIIIIGIFAYIFYLQIPICHFEKTIERLDLAPALTYSNNHFEIRIFEGTGFYDSYEKDVEIVCEDELNIDPIASGLITNPTNKTKYCLITHKKEVC